MYQDALGLFLQDGRVRAVLPHVRGRLLDVGCGANQLVRRYGNGVGVDVHPWPNVDVVVSDAAVLDWTSGTYDTVALIACLNHIINRQAVLHECRRLLRPDGRIVVTMLTPRVSRVWHWLRRRWDPDQRERGMRAGEVYGLKTVEMIEMFRLEGFRLQRTERFMLGFNRLYIFVPSPVLSNAQAHFRQSA